MCGTGLRLILRDGRRVYDRFEGHGSGHIVLREHGKLALNLVKAVTIWKGRQGSMLPETEEASAKERQEHRSRRH